MKKLVVLFAAVVLAFSAAGCGWLERSSTGEMKEKTEMLMREANRQVGMPEVKNFYLRRVMKRIIEKIDDTHLITYAYAYAPVPINGRVLVFLGMSLGYGVPFGAQYTPPEVPTMYRGDVITLPLPDPHGLYTAGVSTDATWLILVGSDGTANLVYAEFPIVVSERPLSPDVAVYPPDFQERVKKWGSYVSEDAAQRALKIVLSND